MAFAPGMKTSLIMMLSDNKARVVAVDISYKRSLLGRQLLGKLGVDLSRVYVVVNDSRDVQLRKVFDKVLLDAPCSNSGAMSKDPGLKITLTESKVRYYSAVQKELISRSVSLGKTVVYSTCSLMPEEGEEVANTVSGRSGFTDLFSGLQKVMNPTSITATLCVYTHINISLRVSSYVV